MSAQADPREQHVRPGAETAFKAPDPDRAPAPQEIGGRDGPEPTRFGDWEKGGRCIDF